MNQHRPDERCREGLCDICIDNHLQKQSEDDAYEKHIADEYAKHVEQAYGEAITKGIGRRDE